MNMIELTGINKIYRTNEIETQALENVNLNVEKGEFLSIMGPSGCGKSTLLNIMGLLDAPTSGTIKIAGTVVEGMKDKELAAFRRGSEEGRTEPPYATHAFTTIRRSVPACCDSTRNYRKSGNHTCRRADR